MWKINGSKAKARFQTLSISEETNNRCKINMVANKFNILDLPESELPSYILGSIVAPTAMEKEFALASNTFAWYPRWITFYASFCIIFERN